MKILDRYILTAFIKTFFSVFAILFFIFVLQGVWIFIADLAGKDLDFIVVLKFLFFYSPKIIPMVLPLSVLLASIMTFGDFSENYEFAAMKSAGISLQRAMRSLIIFILILSAVSFWFTNNVAPKAEYNFVNMRREIIHTKPAMAITAGQFNEIGSFNIKFDKKHGKNGELLDKVIMHVISEQNNQNRTVIMAESGKIKTDENSNLLQLHLYNGNYYEEIVQRSFRQRNRNPFAKAHFKHYVLNIDLSEFDDSENEIQKISNTANMMNIMQLNYTLDSLKTNLNHQKSIQKETQDNYSNTLLSEAITTNNSVLKEVSLDSLFLIKRKAEKMSILSNASAVAENIKFTTLNNQNALLEKTKNINRHTVAFYEKFVVAFSCLLMFFVGAPLGAIIRKGGLGLPMVLAVLIFISYHFINTFGKKLAQENGTTGFMGAWLSTIILLPLAFIFTYKATRDRGINSLDNTLYQIINYFKKIQKKIKHV